MKKIHITILLGCMVFLISSCYTSTTFTVYGEPGTQILNSGYRELATIDNTGKVKIKDSDDGYSAFLISHMPGTDDFVPFALDYKEKIYPGSKIVKCLGYGLSALGCAGLVGGLAVLFSGDEETAIPILEVSGALDLIGIAVGVPGDIRSDQTNHEYCYKYLKTQTTNQDIQLTRPVFESAKVNAPSIQDTPSAKNEPVEIENTISNSSVSNKTLNSSSSTKTLKDYASKIEGTYVGSGTLKQGANLIEDYTGIKVTIKKQTKDIVLVNVVESDGSKFFSSDGEYSIKKNSNGSYSLTLKGIKNATIEIDTKNNLVYLHPRVNIENEIYILNIKAKKQ